MHPVVVFEYRYSLSELLPILSKPKMKPEAYTKKIAKVFNLKNYKNATELKKQVCFMKNITEMYEFIKNNI